LAARDGVEMGGRRRVVIFGEGEVKRRAFVDRGLGPGSAAMALNDAPDDGKADAGAFEVAFGVQALEDSKKSGGVFHIKPDAVIAHEADSFIGVIPAPDFNSSATPWRRIFQRVGEEINKSLADGDRVSFEHRQIADHPFDVTASDLI